MRQQRLRPELRRARSRILKCRSGHGTPALREHTTLITSVIHHSSVCSRRTSSSTAACSASLALHFACRLRADPFFCFARLLRRGADGRPEASSSVAIASPSAAYPSIVCADSGAAPRTSAAELPAALSVVVVVVVAVSSSEYYNGPKAAQKFWVAPIPHASFQDGAKEI